MPFRPPSPSAMPVHFMSNDEILISLGQRIQRHRLSQNLTQSEVAAHAGVSRNSIRKIEAGESVSTSVLVAALRATRLLESFFASVPEVEQNPYEAIVNPTPIRQRARKKAT